MRAGFVLSAFALIASAVPAQDSTAKKKPDASSFDACQEWFHSGHDASLLMFTSFVGRGAKMPIRIFVEDSIQNSDSYRFAAAEVLHDHFSESFTVSTDSELYLYITGTKPDSADGVQMMEVSIRVIAKHPIAFDGKIKAVLGFFEIAGSGGTVGGSQERKAKAVKEHVYKSLSDALARWGQADETPLFQK